MRLEIIHNDNLPWGQLWEQDVMEKGQKDVAISKTVDRHRGGQPSKPQGPQPGAPAAAINGLGYIDSLAAWRTGIVPGHGQVAPRFIPKDQGRRRQQCEGVEEVHAWLLDVWARLLGGAKRFFSSEPEFG